MIQFSLVQIFGENAYQDSNSLVINKAALLGLIPSSTNSAEALLAALLLTAHRNFEGNLEDEQGNVITDELGRNITFSNSNLYELLNVFYWKHQFLVVKNQPKRLDIFVVETYSQL